MDEKYEPCAICEEYIEGVDCGQYNCPIAKMKSEIERLREINGLLTEAGQEWQKRCEIAKSEAIKDVFREIESKCIDTFGNFNYKAFVSFKKETVGEGE